MREGHDIQVVDRQTGRDITSLILSQVVISEEKRGNGDVNGVPGLERGQVLLDYVRRTLNVPASLVSGEMERRRGDLETMIDLAIEQALRRLNIPTQTEIELLNRRLDEISRRIGSAPGARRPTSATRSRTRKASASRRR